MNNNELKVSLRVATGEDKALLKNLQQLYLHDLSAYTENLDINAEGVFENNDIDLFYEKDELIPLMIEYGKAVVGFILFTTPPYTLQRADYTIGDFFILRKYRGRGFGKVIVKELFQTYPGKYTMMQLIDNQTAISFWKKVLSENGLEYEEREVMDGDDKCFLQVFEV